MRPRRSVRVALAAAALAGLVGCATARNYDDPAGPILVGPPVAPRHRGGDVRLVTFNIKFAEHVDRAADLLSRPGPLRDADVLVLQEMDGPGTEQPSRARWASTMSTCRPPSTRRRIGTSAWRSCRRGRSTTRARSCCRTCTAPERCAGPRPWRRCTRPRGPCACMPSISKRRSARRPARAATRRGRLPATLRTGGAGGGGGRLQRDGWGRRAREGRLHLADAARAQHLGRLRLRSHPRARAVRRRGAAGGQGARCDRCQRPRPGVGHRKALYVMA